MGDLFSQLGVNIGALIAQGVNFLVVLVVLTFFVYKPLMRVVDTRRQTIEKGLADAALADTRLTQIGEKESAVLAAAERTALGVVKQAEAQGVEVARGVVGKGEERAAVIIKEAKTLAERYKAEEMASLEREAVALVKSAIIKTVELAPKNVDEKLINEAMKSIRKARA